MLTAAWMGAAPSCPSRGMKHPQTMKAELTYEQKKDPSSVIHYRVEFGNVVLLHGPLCKVEASNSRGGGCRDKGAFPHGLPAVSQAVGCWHSAGTLLLPPLSLSVWRGRSLE